MKAKKKLWYLIFLPPGLLTLLYGAGYLSQLIGNYQQWQNGGGFAGDGTSPAFPSASFPACFQAAFSWPYGAYGFVLAIAFFAVLFLMVMRLGYGKRGEIDRERKLEYADNGTYGTSGFMSEQEAKQILDLSSDV